MEGSASKTAPGLDGRCLNRSFDEGLSEGGNAAQAHRLQPAGRAAGSPAAPSTAVRSSIVLGGVLRLGNSRRMVATASG